MKHCLSGLIYYEKQKGKHRKESQRVPEKIHARVRGQKSTLFSHDMKFKITFFFKKQTHRKRKTKTHRDKQQQQQQKKMKNNFLIHHVYDLRYNHDQFSLEIWT